MIPNYATMSNFLCSKGFTAQTYTPEETAFLSDALTALQGADDIFSAVDHQGASLLQSYFGVKFDDRDIAGWVGSLLTWWKQLIKHEWISPTKPQLVPNKLRIGIFGDWGTGLYGAPACAKNVGNVDLLIHLGDVYYSGTESEIESRFLSLWPKNVGISRSCNANHEMYTGGHGYFKKILPAFSQESSCFAFYNDKWLFIGLDSAYDNFDFNKDQLNWLDKIVDRKIILFCHNQPYSLIDKQGTRLIEKLSKFLQSGKIHAWYWGHQHYCIVHDRHPQWGVYGRCVGHSGYPYRRLSIGERDGNWLRIPERNLVPGGLLLDIPNPYISEGYGANGYVVLEVGDDLVENYYDADGNVLYTTCISNDG